MEFDIYCLIGIASDVAVISAGPIHASAFCLVFKWLGSFQRLPICLQNPIYHTIGKLQQATHGQRHHRALTDVEILDIKKLSYKIGELNRILRNILAYP